MMPNCPRCETPAENRPEREWQVGQYHVSRFACACGDTLNYYTGAKTEFTIPRPFARKSFCVTCKVQNPLEASYCKNCGTKL